MKNTEILEELEKLAAKLDVRIRFELGDFRSGLCRVNDEQHIIVNKKLPMERQVEIIAREMGKFDLGSLYILPKIRELISGQMPVDQENQ